MILMDGGCEFNGYASDITRTWPVDGKFTKEQGTIYGVVLEVQKICLKVWLQFFLATTWFSAPRATQFWNASMESLNILKVKMILSTNMVAPLVYLVLPFRPFCIVYSFY